jgi:small GTP-binding protein
MALEQAGRDLAKEPGFKELADRFSELAVDTSKPPLVLVMGAFDTGKSTFLNALLGRSLLVTNVLPTTAAITVLSHADNVEVRAWNRDGSCDPYSISDLGMISAEGDPQGCEIRSRLKYLEVTLPDKLLQTITLVDTPGLNADNDHHTDATNEFQSRADVVIWLIAHGTPVNQVELSCIKTLPELVNVLLVVNQIDLHDDDEGPIEDLLETVRARLGSIPSAIVGISARDAVKALHDLDPELLTRSRWPMFQRVFMDQVLRDALPNKALRVLERTRELICQLEEKFRTIAPLLQHAHRALRSRADLKRDLKQTRREIVAAFQSWTGIRGKEWSDFSQTGDLPSSVPEAQRLNEVRAVLKASQSEIQSELSAIETRRRTLAFGRAGFDNDLMLHKEDRSKYEHSGLWGNAPWFRNSEWGERVKQRDVALSSVGTEIKSAQAALDTDEKAANGRRQRLSNDLVQFCAKLIPTLEAQRDSIDKSLQDLNLAQDEAKQYIEQHQWFYRMSAQLMKVNIWSLYRHLAEATRELAENGHATIVAEKLEIVAKASGNLRNLGLELGTHRLPEEPSAPRTSPAAMEKSKKSRNSNSSSRHTAFNVFLFALGAMVTALLVVACFILW